MKSDLEKDNINFYNWIKQQQIISQKSNLNLQAIYILYLIFEV